METRANHVWVGAVSLLILGALALFIVWLARLGGGAQDLSLIHISEPTRPY